MQRFTPFFASLVILVLAACEPWPRDPEHTTDMVMEAGELRIGVIHNPPWTDVRGAVPTGRETELIAAFAEALDAKPQWRVVSTHDGFMALQHGEIDVLAGGLVKATPYRKAGFTRPYEISRADDGSRQPAEACICREAR